MCQGDQPSFELVVDLLPLPPGEGWGEGSVPPMERGSDMKAAALTPALSQRERESDNQPRPLSGEVELTCQLRLASR